MELLMHNIELFIGKSKINIENNYDLTYFESNNIYNLPEGRIGINEIVNLKNNIIRNITGIRSNKYTGRYDTRLFYYPGYYVNNKPLFPIVILLKETEFYDKLPVLLFECVCYYLVKQLNCNVYINSAFRKNILTEEVMLSSVNYLRHTKHYSLENFKKKFNLEISLKHYRKYFNYEEYKDNKRLSVLYTDIFNFLKFSVDEDTSNKIAEVVTELVGNACEHAHSDCLLDLDITDNYQKKCKDGNFRGNYYAINIGIVNYSSRLFYHDIREKIKLLSCNKKASGRYKTLLDALKNHKNFFDDRYIEDYFYIVAAFQNKISGRIDNNVTGGTGLKKLINSLQKNTDTSICYMQTGDTIFYFVDKYLDYNPDNWIGFNNENNFLDKPPSVHIFRKSKTFIPGTAYNLSFVFERK